MAKKKTFRDYTAWGSLSANLILKNLPFVFFISFLTIVYIANAHYGEKTVREIQSLEREVIDLRSKCFALRAETMYNSKESEIKKRVEPIGLRSHRGRLKKIVVD